MPSLAHGSSPLTNMTFALGLLFPLVMARPASAAPATGAVQGNVLDEATQAPLAHVAVILTDLDRHASTDAHGAFMIEGVPPGSYSVECRREGYLSLTRSDVIVRPGRATRITVRLRMLLRLATTVEVSSFFAGKERAAPSTLQLSSEEVRRAPGSGGDISRALFVLPGLVQATDEANDLIVRGGSPIENGFYVDNIPIPNTNHFPQYGATGGNITMLNIDFIDDVTVSTGGFDASYGDRLSSIVAIRYREGSRSRIEKQLDLNMAGFGGGIEGPLPGGRGAWMVSARRSYLDVLDSFIDTGGPVRFGDVQGKLVFDAGPRHRISVLQIFGDSRSSEDGTENDNVGWEHHQQYTGGVNWRMLWGERGYSETSASCSTSTSKETWRDVEGMWSESTDYRFTSYGIRNVNHFNVHRAHTLSLGFDVRHDVGRGFDRRIEQYRRLADTHRAGFATYEFRPWQALRLSFGLRASKGPHDEDGVRLAPRAAATLALSGRLSAKATYGVYHQSLPMNLIGQVPSREVLPRPKATHAIIGLQHELTPNTRLTLEVYEKQYREFPLSPAHPTHFVVDDVVGDQTDFNRYDVLLPTGRAFARGLEVSLQKKLARRLYGLMSASIFRSRYQDLNGAWRNRRYDNRYVINLTGGYKPNSRWEFSLRYVLAGGRRETPIDEVASTQAGYTVRHRVQENASHLPAYHQLKLRVDRRFHFRASNLVAYIDLWNVYNQQNVLSRHWSRNQSQVVDTYDFGFMPIVGLQVEF